LAAQNAISKYQQPDIAKNRLAAMIPLQFEKKFHSKAVQGQGLGQAHVQLRRIDMLDITEQLQWARLSLEAGADSIFACNWFVRPVLEQFDKQKAYRLFIAIDANGEWYGVMPIARAHHFGRIPVRNWRNLKNPNQFIGLPLIKKGQETEFWSALLTALDDVPSGAFAFYPTTLPKDHRITKALITHCHLEGRSIEVISSYLRAAINTDLNFSAYWNKAVSKRRQKRISTLEKQLERDHGPIQYDLVTDTASLDRWINEFLVLELAGWKGLNGSAIASSSDSTLLFRCVVRSAFAEGAIACIALRAGEQPIAMSSYFITDGHGYGFKSCFDQNFSRYAPGILLIREIMTVLDNGQLFYFDSCSGANETMISDIWLERREIIDLCIGLKGHRARHSFALIIGARRFWHRLKANMR
jgi:CelD/BcsL family acetyltransferase involved in cellulose biosynthesis